MEIKRVGIIGVGALGVMFGMQMMKNCGPECVSFIADKDRIARYKKDGVYCNGKLCDINFVDKDDETVEPFDLIMVAVKYTSIHDAIDAIRHCVGDNTVIISIINGVVSEEDIAAVYGWEKVLCCVAQGMDSTKDGSRFKYDNMGTLVIGELDNSESEKLRAVTAFFDKAQIKYRVPENIKYAMWSKLMLNVGLNQVLAVYRAPYGEIEKNAELKSMLYEAMRETQAVAKYEGVILTEEDMDNWMKLMASLNPEGYPSMAQDVMAGRKTEVALFSHTIIRLGKKYGVPTPVNQFLSDEIAEIEENF